MKTNTFTAIAATVAVLVAPVASFAPMPPPIVSTRSGMHQQSPSQYPHQRVSLEPAPRRHAVAGLTKVNNFVGEMFEEVFGDFWKSNKDKLLPCGLVALFIALNSIVLIDAGEVGVVSRLGEVSELFPGLHLVLPPFSVEVFSTKTSLLEQSNFVPTNEGLNVELDTSVLYRIEPLMATDIYKTVGPSFSKTIIEPEVSSAVRGLTSEVEAKALYTNGRGMIQTTLKDELVDKLNPRGILIEDVLLKAVVLPKQLTSSIEQKAKAEQESQRMAYVLAKERQEAERKAIEAEGIADFQKIVSKGISPQLLQWKGIEATEHVSKSDNTKIVIVGSGKSGLPIILGD